MHFSRYLSSMLRLVGITCLASRRGTLATALALCQLCEMMHYGEGYNAAYIVTDNLDCPIDS